MWGAMGSFKLNTERPLPEQPGCFLPHQLNHIHEHMHTKLRLAHSVTPYEKRAGPVQPHVRPTHTQKATRHRASHGSATASRGVRVTYILVFSVYDNSWWG